MNTTTLSLAAALVAAGLSGAVAFAQDQAPTTQPSAVQGGDGWRDTMDMGDGMMMRCRMMMDAQLSPTSPEGVMALEQELNLSDEQAARLDQIAQMAQQQAEQVLTDAQRQQLQDLANQPTSMRQMHQEMMRRWQQRMDGRRDQDGAAMPMMCPWDAMMERQMMSKPDASGAVAEAPGSQRAQRSPRDRVGPMACCPAAAPSDSQ